MIIILILRLTSLGSAFGRHIEIKKLTEESSRALCNTSGRSDSEDGYSLFLQEERAVSSYTHHTGLQELLGKLDGLPLIFDAAGSYIRSTGMTVAYYNAL